MEAKKIHLYCPMCGARLLNKEEAVNEYLRCKRCATKVNATYDHKKIYMEIIEERRLNMTIDSS